MPLNFLRTEINYPEIYVHLSRRRMTEQGTEHFMAKLIVAEKAKVGLRHAVVCPNVTGGTKERIAQSKRARAGSLALLFASFSSLCFR